MTRAGNDTEPGSPRSSLSTTEPPTSVRQLCRLPEQELAGYLTALVPAELIRHYDLAAQPDWYRDGGAVYRWSPLHGERALRLDVWPFPNAADPALSLELGDTHGGHLEAGWIVLNDLAGPRYHLDRSADGTPLAIGTSGRNLGEEIRALAAGLAPNQLRPGLRLFDPLIRRVEALALRLGKSLLFVVPLAYHNAVKYEHYGFTYLGGAEELHWIHRQFQPGGFLRRRMDGSRPFRQPWMADTIRGRSWAIRDGVLGRHWAAPQMFKDLRQPTSIDTFPGSRW